MSGSRAGTLVALEGGEASGKSTQAQRLADRRGALLTREPGGTVLGERVRDLLLDPGSGGMDARAEALLLAAARAQHTAEVIVPALAAGREVITDRFGDSSVVYQGYGRGLDPGEVRHLSAWATGGVEPDVVVLFDIGAEDAAARSPESPDRMESAGEAFHQRVREGFLALAAADPERWVVIDGAADRDQVSSATEVALAERLGW